MLQQCRIALVSLELSRRHLVLEHLLDLGVVATLELRKAEVEVDQHGDRQAEEDEADLAAEVGLVGVEQVGHHLGNQTREGSGNHNVDTVSLLSEAHTRVKLVTEHIPNTKRY